MNYDRIASHKSLTTTDKHLFSEYILITRAFEFVLSLFVYEIVYQAKSDTAYGFTDNSPN